jgi:hypothetical protein
MYMIFAMFCPIWSKFALKLKKYLIIRGANMVLLRKM